MRLFTCGSSVALLGFCLLGLTGCGEDNATQLEQQAAKTSGTKVEGVLPPPKDQREFGERSKNAPGGANKASGYPNAKQ